MSFVLPQRSFEIIEKREVIEYEYMNMTHLLTQPPPEVGDSIGPTLTSLLALTIYLDRRIVTITLEGLSICLMVLLSVLKSQTLNVNISTVRQNIIHNKSCLRRTMAGASRQSGRGGNEESVQRSPALTDGMVCDTSRVSCV